MQPPQIDCGRRGRFGSWGRSTAGAWDDDDTKASLKAAPPFSAPRGAIARRLRTSRSRSLVTAARLLVCPLIGHGGVFPNQPNPRLMHRNRIPLMHVAHRSFGGSMSRPSIASGGPIQMMTSRPRRKAFHSQMTPNDQPADQQLPGRPARPPAPARAQVSTGIDLYG